MEKGAPGSGAGQPLDGADEPLRISLTCYQVLRACRDTRADDILATAYQLLQERAAKIDDEPLRRSYLENVPANREIVRWWRVFMARQQMPECTATAIDNQALQSIFLQSALVQAINASFARTR